MTELDPKTLARALTGLFEWAAVNAPRPPSPLAVRLGAHLESDPAGLPVVVSPLAGYERVNFQVALDAYLAEDGREAEVIGLSAMHGYRMGLAELVRSLDGGFGPGPVSGAAEYEPVQVGDREILCVAAGLWLISDGDERLLLMLRRNEQGPHMAELGLEVMAGTREAADGLLAELRALMDQDDVLAANAREIADVDAVAKTEGVSPAFIRELLRRAALMAAELGHGTRVDDHDLHAALDELRQSGDELTATLLGARDAPTDR